MGYSITFGAGNDTRNTWTHWKLLPESPPVVPAPKPKTNYVDIPGRLEGPLDMSIVPFNRQPFERITGSWNFVICDDYWHNADRKTTYESIRHWLHARVTRMVLEEDQVHYYHGRFTVDPPNTGMGPFVIRINYDLAPLRYNLADGTPDASWLPDIQSWIDAHELPEGITSITDAQIHELFES